MTGVEENINYNVVKNWLVKHCHKKYNIDNHKHEKEFNLLCRLLDRHPSKANWKYNIPEQFHITRSRANKAVVLYVTFQGCKKSRIVSWVVCAKGKLKTTNKTRSEADKLNSAMRHAVRRQIKQYRKMNVNRVCHLCGSTNRIEVDHHPLHFKDIKEDYIKMKAKKSQQPPTDFDYHPKKGISMFKSANKKWKTNWQGYHKRHATYRYLCSDCNKKTMISLRDK